MSTISVSLPADGETIEAADYNTPITTIVNEINGGISNANINASAAIAGTKLASSALFDRGVNDTSGNEIVKYTANASAVNEITVTNAATTNAPQIAATGDDSNVDLRLVPKGTGNVKRGSSGGAIDWWEELGRTTLSSTADTVSISSFSARKYLMVIARSVNSGALDIRFRFNNDSGSNYAYRYSGNGGAETTGSSAAQLQIDSGSFNFYTVLEIVNEASREKLVFGRSNAQNTAGAGNIPGRIEFAGKWTNTSAQITRIDLINGGAGDFASGTELVVLGHD